MIPSDLSTGILAVLKTPVVSEPVLGRPKYVDQANNYIYNNAC